MCTFCLVVSFIGFDCVKATDSIPDKVFFIFQNKCGVCHGGPFLDFKTYPFYSDSFHTEQLLMNEVKQRIQGTKKQMPPVNGTPLTAEEIELLLKWIDSWNVGAVSVRKCTCAEIVFGKPPLLCSDLCRGLWLLSCVSYGRSAHLDRARWRFAWRFLAVIFQGLVGILFKALAPRSVDSHHWASGRIISRSSLAVTYQKTLNSDMSV